MRTFETGPLLRGAACPRAEAYAGLRLGLGPRAKLRPEDRISLLDLNNHNPSRPP